MRGAGDVDDEHRQIEDSATAKNEYNATKMVRNEDGWGLKTDQVRIMDRLLWSVGRSDS